LEIIRGKFGLGGKFGVFEVGGGSLGFSLGGLDGVADEPPQIQFPRSVQREVVGGESGAAYLIAAAKNSLPADAGIEIDGREILGLGFADQGMGGEEVFKGGDDVLVGNGNLALKSIEARVVKHFPPVAADDGVVWRGGLPEVGVGIVGAGIFLESGGGRDGGAGISGHEVAAGAQGGQGDDQENASPMRM